MGFLESLALNGSSGKAHRLDLSPPARSSLSWICSMLVKFRLCGFAAVGSIHSLSGLASLRPSANPLYRYFASQKATSRQRSSSNKKNALKDIFFISGQRDSNSRSSPWEGDILPLNYARIFLSYLILSYLLFLFVYLVLSSYRCSRSQIFFR